VKFQDKLLTELVELVDIKDHHHQISPEVDTLHISLNMLKEEIENPEIQV
jgi:hypothetical protein